eukprot:13262-Heterococcus_DN1.PRE.1
MLSPACCYSRHAQCSRSAGTSSVVLTAILFSIPVYCTIRYLQLILTSPEGVVMDLEAVASRILSEVSTSPSQATITFTDFSRVIQSADLKLYIPLAYAGRQLTNVLHEFNKCKADS